MRLIILALAAALTLPVVASADLCSWSDGVSTVLGTFGNLTNPTNVGGPEPTNSSPRALRVTEDPHSGTPQALIAMVEGLTDGDVVDGSFFGYDTTPGASPSMRIWAHYGLSGDIGSYEGSASGNLTYTDGSGWSEVAYSWTFDSNGGTRDALIIEARLYSTPSTCDTCATDYYIDTLNVTTTSSTATIILPCEEVTPTVNTTWGQIKSTYDK